MITGIDHHRAVLDPRGADELRFADRADHDVGLAQQCGQIGRARMTDDNRRIGVQQHGGHRFTEDRTAPDHHRQLTRQRHLVMGKQPHDAGRRGRAPRRLAHRHAPEAIGRDAIDVLGQRDAIKTGALVDLRRHRVLQQNAVDVGIGVERVDARQ